jgi:hypothetical protein
LPMQLPSVLIYGVVSCVEVVRIDVEMYHCAIPAISIRISIVRLDDSSI